MGVAGTSRVLPNVRTISVSRAHLVIVVRLQGENRFKAGALVSCGPRTETDGESRETEMDKEMEGPRDRKPQVYLHMDVFERERWWGTGRKSKKKKGQGGGERDGDVSKEMEQNRGRTEEKGV